MNNPKQDPEEREEKPKFRLVLNGGTIVSLQVNTMYLTQSNPSNPKRIIQSRANRPRRYTVRLGIWP